MENDRHIDYRLREQVLKRDGYKCRYCGKDGGNFHMDHVYPFSKGGETSYSNLVTACSTCNLKKHNSVGMWPKPIGYFDNPDNKKRHSPYITLVTMFGVSFMMSGVLVMNSAYYLQGAILFIAGMAIAIFSMTVNLQRP